MPARIFPRLREAVNEIAELEYNASEQPIATGSG
jgi:hypothetical protein